MCMVLVLVIGQLFSQMDSRGIETCKGLVKPVFSFVTGKKLKRLPSHHLEDFDHLSRYLKNKIRYQGEVKKNLWKLNLWKNLNYYQLPNKNVLRKKFKLIIGGKLP